MLPIMKRAIAMLAAAAAYGLAAPVSATTVVKMELEDLAVQADRAVRGTVDGVVTRDVEGRMYTFVTLKVSRDLIDVERVPDVGPSLGPGQKGDATVTVRLLGGVSGEMGQYVPGTPSFSKGDDVVLFLRQGHKAPEMHHLIGLSQSVYRVRETEGGPVAVRDLEGLARASIQGGETRVEESAQEAAIPLETLEARVREAREAAKKDRTIDNGSVDRQD